MIPAGPHTRNQIEHLATVFRRAMQEALNATTPIPDCLSYFPEGACGWASEMLGEVLNQYLEGQVLFVACTDKLDPETHAWLRYGEFVIDITGDQFKGRPPVFVGRPDSWFDHWDEDEETKSPARYTFGRDLGADKIFRAIRLRIDATFRQSFTE